MLRISRNNNLLLWGNWNRFMWNKKTLEIKKKHFNFRLNWQKIFFTHCNTLEESFDEVIEIIELKMTKTYWSTVFQW